MAYGKTRRRDRIARVALRQAQRYGEQASFTAVGAAAVDVYVMLASYEHTTQLRRAGETDDYSLVVVVPRQTSFPPAAFTPGDLLQYPKTTGRVYMVENVKPDIEDPNMASTFALKLGRFGETAEIG